MNGPEELNVVVPAARLYGIPVVVWSHAREVSPWMRRLSRLWPHVLRDTRFAAVSPLARQVLVDGGLARLDEVEIVPNPIDADDVVGEPDGHDGLVVGYLGSDARYKGFQLLPGIVEELADLPIRVARVRRRAPRQRSVGMGKAEPCPPIGFVRRQDQRCSPGVRGGAMSCCVRRFRNRSAGSRRRRC